MIPLLLTFSSIFQVLGVNISRGDQNLALLYRHGHWHCVLLHQNRSHISKFCLGHACTGAKLNLCDNIEYTILSYFYLPEIDCPTIPGTLVAIRVARRLGGIDTPGPVNDNRTNDDGEQPTQS